MTAEELDERVQAAYSARTTAELASLRADLPELPPSPAEVRAELQSRRARLQRQLLQQTGGALSLFVLFVVIWLAAGAHDGFWPVWFLIFPVLSLLRNGWRLYGPAPELEQVERELGRRNRRDRHRRERNWGGVTAVTDTAGSGAGTAFRQEAEPRLSPASGSGPSPA
ncbi:MAG: DUF1707 domain-containing protein [Actinomycetota bacterium]|nr:DUF1707 domain-containing protein [Actinomycetota bacterium]